MLHESPTDCASLLQNCLKKSKQSVVNNDDDQGEADAASGGDSSGRDNEKGWGLATGEDD